MKKYIIGVDIGASAIKTAVLLNGVDNAGNSDNADSEIIKTSFNSHNNFNADSILLSAKREIKSILEDINIIEKVVVTGVGSSFIHEDLCGIRTQKLDEFTAMANGVKKITGLSDALIVSMGTGTAFVKLWYGSAVHIGGCGVGGGTLIGLSSLLTGIDNNNIENILNLVKIGDLSKVDLQIKDITDESFNIPNLPKHVTAANFGKISKDAAKADIIAGVMNTVCQTIGMLAAFACKSAGIKDVVLIGKMAKIADGAVFNEISLLHGLNFILPPNAEYICAIGAANHK